MRISSVGINDIDILILGSYSDIADILHEDDIGNEDVGRSDMRGVDNTTSCGD